MTGLDRKYGLPPGTLFATAFHGESALAAVTGAMTDEEWRVAIAASLAGACGSADRAAELVAEWGRQAARVDEEVRGLLLAVRRRVPVVLVSNATTRLEADLAALGLSDVADHVVNTSRIGAAKPDPRVYHIAAERAGAPPARCLFVDDTAENVAAAVALGMTGLHYRRAGQLRRALGPLVPAPRAPSGRD
ncbi:HAD family hydrolase [Streptomyces hoynatensis]|uniref:HAD family hydrolase n=2 Tax=Streptomyces hoynatensis TaxID=1141874 RepID=A0A3A9Z7P3_9ACTN|nr:HAD family hydrolase [Streptomyces hoynatensis]